MPEAQRTITIDRPAVAVFAFFTDPANDPKWRTDVKDITAGALPLAVGSSIHQVIAGPGGHGIPADIEVTAYDPPIHYAFTVTAGPVRPRGEYRFAPSGDATEVTFTLRAELSGFKKVFMSKSVQKSMNGQMVALDTAKALIESV